MLMLLILFKDNVADSSYVANTFKLKQMRLRDRNDGNPVSEHFTA